MIDITKPRTEINYELYILNYKLKKPTGLL